MADYYQAQDVFSKGELSPTMYARVTTSTYFKGLKKAQNVLPIPQGGAKKRFGTTLSGVLSQTDYTLIKPIVFEYLDQCIYQVVFYDNKIDIWLEGYLIATVTGTNIDETDLKYIDYTVLGDELRITTGLYQPQDLARSGNAANIISAVDAVNNYITLTTAITAGPILPIVFTTAGTLPVTTPQIKVNRIYFYKAFSTTNVAIYSTVDDARLDTNRFVITSVGAGVSNIVTQNNWAFANTPFLFVPTFDFTGGYSTNSFTVNASTGSVTLTATSNVFTTAHVGGLFSFTPDGSVGRITAYTDQKNVTMQILGSFVGTGPYPGAFSKLTEPAWSNLRGWPLKCSSYQNRAFFANTDLIPNGLWGSFIGDYNDFDDSETTDSYAIAWYPTSNVGSEINFMTPFKSLLVHTESGIYSTPQGSDTPITPKTFSLSLQDNTPTANIQPVVIDNQVIVISGVDVHSLLYDLIQSGYTPNIISAPSEHLITNPTDMQPFRDRYTNGGRYVFIVNSDGTMAMYQTLYSEEVSGWTQAIAEQSYGNAYYRYVLSSVSGRCWFVMQRDIAVAQAPIAITAFDPVLNTLTAVASNFSTTVPTAVLFTTTGALPVTSPQIKINTYYFVLGITADIFTIYTSESDAQNLVNQYVIVSAGTNSNVVPYPLTTNLMLEELSNDVYTDCTIQQNGTGITSITGLTLFNAQSISVKGDGWQFDSNPVLAGVEQITIMGVSQPINMGQVGFAINYIATPMPISVAVGGSVNTSNLAQAKHVRFVNVICQNSIGGQVNGQNIALTTLPNINLSTPPVGKTGIFQVSTLGGWNDFDNPVITIMHNDPFPFNLIGLFYNMDV